MQYSGYDVDRGLWWWEFMVLGRKVVMLGIVSFITGPIAQVLRLFCC